MSERYRSATVRIEIETNKDTYVIEREQGDEESLQQMIDRAKREAIEIVEGLC